MNLSPRDFEVLRPASLEAEGRPYRVKKLEVLDYTPDLKKKGPLLVSPGCVALFLSPKGSPLLGNVRKAAEAKDGFDRKFADELGSMLQGRPMMPLSEAVALLIRQRVFASLRFGGRTLATSLFVPPEVPLATVALPYNGGQLARDGFTLVEHYREGLSGELDGVLVRHSPDLTRAEKAALQKLPADMLELNVGTAAFCFALSAIAVAAAVSLATGICCPSRELGIVPLDVDSTPIPDLHLADSQLKTMSGAAAARSILRIRREILEQRF